MFMLPGAPSIFRSLGGEGMMPMRPRWPPPPKEPPTTEKKRLFKPAPDDLRALVFDYLCHSSYTSTAGAFVRDSEVKHLDLDGDEIMVPGEGKGSVDPLAATLEERVRTAKLRKDIRIHILSGRIDEAMSLLHTYFPTVLPQEGHLTTPSPLPTCSDSDSFSYISSTSVDPAHLHLNLRILEFIESTRTVPLPYDPSSYHFHPSLSSVSASASTRSRTPVPRGSVAGMGVSEEPEVTEQQEMLLAKVQKLYAETWCLPKAGDRALYLKELAQVSALLAYPEPEKSMMAPYLAQERRDAVADQVERAILHRSGESPISHIELCVRYTTALWGCLFEREARAPPRAKWPPGVQLPPDSLSLVSAFSKSSSDGDDKSGAKAEKEGERIPPFDLTDFLDFNTTNK